MSYRPKRIKKPVRVATGANIATLAGGAPDSIGAVSLVANDRVLVKEQSTASENGIYIVDTVGTGSDGSWSRAGDYNNNTEVNSGDLVFVIEGTAAGLYHQSSIDPIIVDTTDQVWVSFSTATEEINDGNIAYLDNSGVTTFYVNTAGSDESGDGLSVGGAFATPQRAFNELPNQAFGTVKIIMGPGTYPAPLYTRQGSPNGLLIRVIADLDNADITLSSPSMALKSGKTAQWEGNVGAYGATITDGSHWVQYGAESGYPVLASTTPDLNVIAHFNIGAGAVAVHPYNTIFDTSYLVGCADPNMETDRSLIEVNFVGIEFNTPSGARMLQSCFTACHFVNTPYMVRTIGFTNCTWSANCEVYAWGETDRCAFGGLFLGSLVVHSGVPQMFGCVTRSAGNQVQVGRYDQFIAKIYSNRGWDFEGTGICIRLYSNTQAYFNADATISNSPSQFIFMDNKTLFETYGRTITGSTTGVCVQMKDGALAIGIGASAGLLTNSVTPGDEIIVGEGADEDSLSSLPITDLSSGSRAT